MEKSKKVTRIHREIASLSKDQLIQYIVDLQNDVSLMDDRFKSLETFVINELTKQRLLAAGITEKRLIAAGIIEKPYLGMQILK